MSTDFHTPIQKPPPPTNKQAANADTINAPLAELDAAIGERLDKSQNLADLVDAAAARANLGNWGMTDVSGVLALENGGTGLAAANVQELFEHIAADGGETGALTIGVSDASNALTVERSGLRQWTMNFGSADVNIAQDGGVVYWDGLGGGRFIVSNTSSDAADKQLRLGSRHYDTSEEPFLFFLSNSFLTGNNLSIGGGSSLGNAATEINLFAAANNTTPTGTKIAGFDIDGLTIYGATNQPHFEVRAVLGQTEPIAVLAADSTGNKKVYVDSAYKLYVIDDMDWVSMRVGESTSKYIATAWRNGLEQGEIFTSGYGYDIAINNTAVINSDGIKSRQGFAMANLSPQPQQAYIASPTNEQLRDIFITFGFMASS